MKLIKRHLFGGILNSLKQFLNPTYSIDERPTGPTPPAPGWTKMEPLESDVSIKPKVRLSKPSISNTVLTDALSINNNIVTPILKSIFTDAYGKPYEYKEVNTNIFNKRFPSSLEASDFLDNKRNQWKQNDSRYALRSLISKHLPGGRVLPTAPPPSDNTRVSKIPNKGEGIYEATSQGIGDFLPLVGTYRAAQRIDKGEPNASYGDFAMNLVMDLLGAGMVGSVVKAAGKANRIHKALKSRGFTQITKEPTHWVRTPKYVTTGLGDKLYSWQVPFTETAVKVIPNVDYTNVAMQPLIQTLRVPATAPFK